MLTKFTLALGCVLLLPMQIASSAPPTPKKRMPYFARPRSAVATKATPWSKCQKTTNYQGGLYMLAGFRFEEDGALAWTASCVTPFQGASLERGT
jgi:hypothetical protein